MTASSSKLSFKPLLAEKLHKQLLEHIIQGEQQEAEILLKKNPSLLFFQGKVDNFEGTAYQLALGEEDEEMVLMMQPYFLRLKNGNAEMQKQQREKFPEEYEKHEKEKQLTDEKALHDIIKTIGDSKAPDITVLNKDCADELQKFRNHLTPRGPITIGKHYNAKLLLKAFELYDDEKRYKDFGGSSNSPKNIFFWDEVIKYIMEVAPVNYQKSFKICIAMTKKNRRLRSAKPDNDRGLYASYGFFFPHNDVDPLSYSTELFPNDHADLHAKRARYCYSYKLTLKIEGIAGQHWRDCSATTLFSDFLLKKQNRLAELMQPSTSCCVIT